jgi:hypothetical protein
VVGRPRQAAMERQIMRGAIRSVVGSMAAIAVTLSASAAMACSSESGHSTRVRSATTRLHSASKADASLEGAKIQQGAPGKKGAVDDRLVRPPRLDASAGVLG